MPHTMAQLANNAPKSFSTVGFSVLAIIEPFLYIFTFFIQFACNRLTITVTRQLL